MPTHKKLTWDDHIGLLRILSNHSVKEAAVELNLTEAAVRSRLNSLRKTISYTQSKLNEVRTLQRLSPRVRKLSTDGKIPDAETEDGANF